MHSADFIQSLNQALPQTQCEKCDYPGCLPYATAIATQGAAINRCQPGGKAVVEALAQITGQPVIAPLHPEPKPQVAYVQEENCIGCTLCIQACPVDAIIGSSKQLHTILTEACTGCGLCLPPCPTSCIEFEVIELKKSTSIQNQQKLIFKTRYEAKQLRDKQQVQHKLKNHFALTNTDLIHQKLANLLPHDTK